VFNSEWHQGYSYPPNQNPFDAYWVDDAVGVRVGDNTPPYTPNSPNPANGSTNVDIHKQLSWAGGDANPFDAVSYDVYFGTTSPPPKVSSNQSGTSYNPGTLNLLTTYYWRIVSWDNQGATATGPIWQFTTRPNHAPNTPSNPTPKNGTTNVPINQQLSWTGGDQDSGDTVTYDVYFGTTSPPPKVVSNQSVASYNPGTLSYTTKYYWKIVAWDNHGLSAIGPIWQFTTGTFQNNAPNAPDISGPGQGKPGTSYPFTMTATDPDSDQLYYFIDWGDNTTTDWDGPHASGAGVTFTHSWSVKNTYTVKAKVKDEHGVESDWGTLTIIIPTKFIPHFTLLELLQKLLARFPLLERLLLQ
jgi:hypothetical protein